MSDLNVVALVGRLTRDAVMRSTAKGIAVCCFSIAVNRSRKREDNTWEDIQNFILLNLYGERAQNILPYLVKGQTVSVQGHLKIDSWETPAGKRSRLEVAIDDLRFIGPPPNRRKEGEKGDQDTPGTAPFDGEEASDNGEVEAAPDLDMSFVYPEQEEQAV
jgi:single-strand DNA-binding protein